MIHLTGWIETETGVSFVDVEAATKREAIQVIREQSPDDIGADCEIEDEDGNQVIPW